MISSSYFKNYRRKNIEKLRAYRREYYKKNQQKLLEYARVYNKKNRVKLTLYFRSYRELHRKKIRDYVRKYNKLYRKEHGYHNEQNSKRRYPLKEKARKILQRAVKNGKMQRMPCMVCNKKGAQAHHSDYSKPLEVKWFCALHHAAEHQKMRSRLIHS